MPHRDVRGGTTALCDKGFSHRPCHEEAHRLSCGSPGRAELPPQNMGGLEPPQTWALRASRPSPWGNSPVPPRVCGAGQGSARVRRRLATGRRNTQWTCQHGKSLDTHHQRSLKGPSEMAAPRRSGPECGFLRGRLPEDRSEASRHGVVIRARSASPVRHVSCVSVGRVRTTPFATTSTQGPRNLP